MIPEQIGILLVLCRSSQLPGWALAGPSPGAQALENKQQPQPPRCSRQLISTFVLHLVQLRSQLNGKNLISFKNVVV